MEESDKNDSSDISEIDGEENLAGESYGEIQLGKDYENVKSYPKKAIRSDLSSDAEIQGEYFPYQQPFGFHHETPGEQLEIYGERTFDEVPGEMSCKDETEMPQQEIKDKIEKESTASSETLSSVYTKLSPFTIKWSFGVKRSVELINLTTADTFEVFYVSSHFGVIYNYRSNKMTFLPGHNFPIRSITSDASGRWLASADAGEDTVIVIWDNKNQIPVWTLYNVFPGGVKCVKLSQDARFLTALNCDFTFSVKFWLWTYGCEEPDGVIDLDRSFGKGKHVNFNHLHTEQFIITAEFWVLFCEWNKETKTLDSYEPERKPTKKKLGIFRESLFLDDNHTTITSTSLGQMVVWCDVKYSDPINENVPGSIRKEHMKTVKIHKSGITCMRLCDKIIASTSEDGTIFFHDQYLRLMYWMPQLKLEHVVSVSFNLVPYTEGHIDPFFPKFDETTKQGGSEEIVQEVHDFDEILSSESSASYDDTSYINTKNTNSSLVPRSSSHERPGFDKMQFPSDYTVNAEPFPMRDFIFLSWSGKFGYVSHRRRKIKSFLYNIDAPALCLACNPYKQHVVVGYKNGRVTLYEYFKKMQLLTSKVSNSAIVSLRYSHMGHRLMAGLQNGCILELDPLLLNVNAKIEISKSAIGKICFSPLDDLMAYYDEASTVHLHLKKMSMRQWLFMGKYVSHYKPIRDIEFEIYPESPQYPRLFSIGEDRMLVEYDTRHLEDGKLKILGTYRIEQTAIPRCFTWHPKFYNEGFLISNNEYKLKVIDADRYICLKTTLGPTADTPINFMTVIPGWNQSTKTAKLIYATEKHIGIRILPSSGNPFEGMGMVGHPEKIVFVAISHDFRYIFTAGVNEPSVLMWEVNADSVDVSSQLGGTGLEPFVSLIEGGPTSFLFKEIEDFFYYAQIIHQGEDPNMERSVSKYLALCEVPDLFRALGYFPTDYEVNNLLYELKHMKYNETGEFTEEISFEEIVKAYLNHKPVHGISLEHINKALMSIADLTDPSDIIVEKNELYKALEEGAEAMDHAEVVGYLCILLLPKDESNPIPHNLSLSEFAENVLGIDLTISEENVRDITHAFETKPQ